jgi:putative transposase
MTNINKPASTDEIAAVLGKSKDTVERMAKKQGWQYNEEATKGRHKKRLYVLKNLPKDIQQALFTYRFNSGVNHGQHPISGGSKRSPAKRIQVAGTVFNDVPDQIPDARGYSNGGNNAAVDISDHERLGGNGTTSVRNNAVTSDRKSVQPDYSNQGTGADEADTTTGSGQSKTGLAVNPIRKDEGALAPVRHGGLSTVDAAVTDERQRLIDGARQVILTFVGNYPGSDAAACDYLTQGYADGELTPNLVHAIQHCNDKKNENRIGKISPSTLGKWRRMKKATGHCLPAKTRVKTDWRNVWWFEKLLEFYRKPQKPKLTEAYADFKSYWQGQGLALEELPSYSAVNRLLATVPLVYRETGRSTGSELAALKAFKRRDWSGPSNWAWVGDGHTFKAKVRHPEHGQAFAPEVTVIIDAASRFIVGWAFSLSENQIAVSEALGQAMLKHGKPLLYYSDNGSGQTAKTIDCDEGGMLTRLGVAHPTGIPGNPQGRGLIEGLWDITAIAVAKTFTTFQGTGMDGDTLRKNTIAINKAKRKGAVPEFVPPWQEFMRACEERFDTYNREHKHSALGGKTPAEVYYAGFDENPPCKLTDDEALNLYRPWVERTPARGEVRWINNIYFHQKLAELPGKTKVRMAYDLHNPNHVWISDLQGRFICIAEWDGNKVDGFAKSYVEKLADDRLNGIEKREMDKIELARQERYGPIDGEVLQRIPAIPQEVLEPLIRVQPIPKEAEEPLKSPVIVGGFNRQEPETKMMTRLETLEMIQKMKEAKNPGG